MSTYSYKIFQPSPVALQYSNLYHAILDSIITVCLRVNPDLEPKKIEDAVVWSTDGVAWSYERPSCFASGNEIHVYAVEPTKPTKATDRGRLAFAVGTDATYVGLNGSLVDLRGRSIKRSDCLGWLQDRGWLDRRHLTKLNVPAAKVAFQHAVDNGHIAALQSMVSKPQ